MKLYNLLVGRAKSINSALLYILSFLNQKTSMAGISWFSSAAWNRVDWAESLKTPNFDQDTAWKRSISCITTALVLSNMLTDIHDQQGQVSDLQYIHHVSLSHNIATRIAFYSPRRQKVCDICIPTDGDTLCIHTARNEYGSFEVNDDKYGENPARYDGVFGEKGHILPPREHRHCLTPERYFDTEFEDAEPVTCTYCGWYPSYLDHDCEEENGSGEYMDLCFNASAYG